MGSSVILPTPGQPATGPDAGFTQGAIPNLVQFRFERVDPPTPIYIQRDDVMVVQGVTQNASDSLKITIRLLQPFAQFPGQPDQGDGAAVTRESLIGPGYIQTIQQLLQLPGPRVGNFVTIPMSEGYLLSLSIVANVGGTRGATFARAWLNRGPVSASFANTAQILFSDYVTFFAPAGWPSGRVLSPADGPGLITSYQQVTVTAGTDFTLNTNSPGRVRFISGRATFTASAAVGNRFISFSMAPLTVGITTVQDTNAVTASQVVTYSFGPGGTLIRGGGTPLFVTLPWAEGVPFGNPNIVVTSSTQGIQAADAWSNVTVVTEEWLDSF